MASAAAVPSTVETTVEIPATISELVSASMASSLRNISPYHRVETPCHTATRLPPLKE